MKLLQATLYTGHSSYTNTASSSGSVGTSSSGSSRHVNNTTNNGNINVATGGVKIPTIEGATVTEHVVDVVAALATRARTLLLSPQTLLQDSGSGTSTASSTAVSLTVVDTPSSATSDSTGDRLADTAKNTTEHNHNDATGRDGDVGTPALLPLEFELHEHTVRLLWQWSRDGSGTISLHLSNPLRY